MIKLSKFLYIHFTTILLFGVCYFNRNLELLAISYTSIFLHEIAHCIAAQIIGLKISHIVMYPFGVNLKLKNTLVYSIWDEIILYLSGPLINAIISVLALPSLKYGNLWKVLYWNNIMLFLFNLLPIIPMDGGIILKKVLIRRIGYKLSEKVLSIISVVLIFLLLVCELILIVYNYFNFTLIFVCIFLFANIFTNKEKYHIDYIKEMMFCREKNNFKIKKVKCILIKSDTDYKELLKSFSQGSSYIIMKEDATGKIKEILTSDAVFTHIGKWYFENRFRMDEDSFDSIESSV